MLRALVDEHPEEIPRIVAVAIARHLLNCNVRQKGQDDRRPPHASVVLSGQRHRRIRIVSARVSRVVEEAECDDDGGRQFAVGEGDVDVFARFVRQQGFAGCVHPREAEGAGNGVRVSSIVEILDVVHVLEVEPVIGRKHIKRAEGRRAANDGLISAKLLHAHNVVRGEVELRRKSLEALHDGLRVLLFVLLGEVSCHPNKVQIVVHTDDCSLPYDELYLGQPLYGVNESAPSALLSGTETTLVSLLLDSPLMKDAALSSVLSAVEVHT